MHIQFISKPFPVWSLTAAVLLAIATQAAAQEPAAATRSFESEIAQLRRGAEDVRNAFRDLDGAMGAHTELFQPDLPLAKQWFDAMAARYEQIAALFEQGKEQEARAAWGEADKRWQRQGRWRERLERRTRQQDLAPHEQWLADHRRWMPKGEALADQWCEARKAASEAMRRAAEVTTPDAPDATVTAAVEQANEAVFTAMLMEWQVHFYREYRTILNNRSITPEVDQKLSALEKTQAALVEANRQQAEIEKRIRQLNAQRTAEADDLRRTYQVAEEEERAAKLAKRKAAEEERERRQQERREAREQKEQERKR